MDQLSDYSREILGAMDALAPEWERRFPEESYGQGSIEFVLAPPHPDVPEMVLTTANDELTLQWGFGELHLTYTGEGAPAEQSVKEALQLISEIEVEKWVLVEGKSGRWFGKFWGMVPVEEFRDLKAGGRLFKAASWRGSYVI